MKFSFEAVKIAVRQDRNGYVVNLSVHPDEVPDALLRSPVGTRYAVAMVEWDTMEMEALEPPPVAVVPIHKPWSMMKQASVLCKSEQFQNWIGAFTEASATAALKLRLGIDSRKELEYNEPAREKFLGLVKDFNSRSSNPAAPDYAAP
ncbi:hypothetical protein UFOVP28_60 [uncultured Caudovirales phage]|uniref:Uncharacterized protein n=1 Tax=uncultured Caudovirales phage TaxID=2100421 RepID=A0A6J5KNS4_9CAUD|nr:hypothetical protein UFOVP28_60 [uncultured Caudovirales phage]